MDNERDRKSLKRVDNECDRDPIGVHSDSRQATDRDSEIDSEDFASPTKNLLKIPL